MQIHETSSCVGSVSVLRTRLVPRLFVMLVRKHEKDLDRTQNRENPRPKAAAERRQHRGQIGSAEDVAKTPGRGGDGLRELAERVDRKHERPQEPAGEV